MCMNIVLILVDITHCINLEFKINSMIKWCWQFFIITLLLLFFCLGKQLLHNIFQLFYFRTDRSRLCSLTLFSFAAIGWSVPHSLSSCTVALSLIVKFTLSVSLHLLGVSDTVWNPIPECTQLSSHQRLLGGIVISFRTICKLGQLDLSRVCGWLVGQG